MLTRRVYRSGERVYLINKQPCRLKDIYNIFYGSGISSQEILSSRSLIAPQIAGEFVSVLTATAPRISMDQSIRSATTVEPKTGGTETLTPPTTYGLEPLDMGEDTLGMGGDETMF